MCRDEFAGDGRVYPVIVVGCEVDRRECAADEFLRGFEIGGEQVLERVIDALGLQDAVAAQRPGLAQGPVDGRYDRIRIRIDRARAVFQFANEELVERAEIVRHPAANFVELHTEYFHEAPDQQVLDGRLADTSQPVHERREREPRQQVLHNDEES